MRPTRPGRVGAALALAIGLALPGPVLAASASEVSVFDLPLAGRNLERLGALVDAGRADRAAQLAVAIAERFPRLPEAHLGVAMAEIAAGRLYTARRAFARALAEGLADPEAALGTARLAPLARDAATREAIATRGPVTARSFGPAEPAPIRAGVASVEEANTEWNAAARQLVARFVPAAPPAEREVAADRGWAGALETLRLEGAAQGAVGLLYDNRDRGHATLRRELFPGIARTVYSEAAKERRIDYGGNTDILFDLPTVGNSSTALGGKLWRSQARQLLTAPAGQAALARQYATNHIYVYPEHKDHDPRNGDTFPVNTPYMLVSQGSSGSDRWLVQAALAAMAALPPATREAAATAGLLAPLAQKLVREAAAPGTDRAAYLDGRAHPSVFEARGADLVRVVARAQEIGPEEIPPQVRLTVVSETAPRQGREIFTGGLGNRFLDSPSAIGRVHRTTDHRLQMRLSAAETRDPNGRPLRFVWKVLRGDAARIRIEPLDEAGEVVDVSIPWHAPYPVPGREDLETHRVDIGVFADNGAELSAPAFLSVAYPPNQARRYDGEGRVRRITYAAPGEAGRYADPKLFLRQGWTDSYEYGSNGTPLGWTRTHADGREESYTVHGHRVLTRDVAGRPAMAEAVRYVSRQASGQVITVDVVPTGQRLAYRYADRGDRTGFAVPAQ